MGDYKVNLAGIDMVLENILEMETALIVPGITTPHRFGEQTAVDNDGLDKQHETFGNPVIGAQAVNTKLMTIEILATMSQVCGEDFYTHHKFEFHNLALNLKQRNQNKHLNKFKLTGDKTMRGLGRFLLIWLWLLNFNMTAENCEFEAEETAICSMEHNNILAV